MKRIAQKQTVKKCRRPNAQEKVNALKIGFHVMKIIMQDLIETNASFEWIVTQNVLKKKDTFSVRIQVLQVQTQNGWTTTALFLVSHVQIQTQL